MNINNPFQSIIENKVDERRVYYEKERVRILEALKKEFVNDPDVMMRIERVIKR